MGIDMDSYTLPGSSKDLIVFVELTRSGRLFMENGDGWEVSHETALPRSDRQALARALPILPDCSPTADKNIFGQYIGSDDEFGMGFLEIFSVPRIAIECCKTGLTRTESMDFLTGWDFRDPKVKREALLMQRQAKPFCTFVCPPCRMFCIMHENLSRDNMGEQRWGEELGEALAYLDLSMNILTEQANRGSIGIFEHPYPSRSWDTESVSTILQRPDAMFVIHDMCRDGLSPLTAMEVCPANGPACCSSADSAALSPSC